MDCVWQNILDQYPSNIAGTYRGELRKARLPCSSLTEQHRIFAIVIPSLSEAEAWPKERRSPVKELSPRNTVSRSCAHKTRRPQGNNSRSMNQAMTLMGTYPLVAEFEGWSASDTTWPAAHSISN